METKRQLAALRNRDIYNVYKQILRTVDVKNVPLCKIMEMVSQSPAPRFYISIEQARRYITAIEKGRKIKLSGRKADQCKDLYEIYMAKKNSMRGYFKSAILAEVVTAKAKSFYVSPGRVYRILFPKQ